MNRVKTEIPATLEEAAQAGRVCMDVKKRWSVLLPYLSGAGFCKIA